MSRPGPLEVTSERVSPIVKFFVDRFVLSIAVFGALVLFGLITLPRLGVDLLPSFNVPIVAVTISDPGAAPSVVANQISKPVTNTLATLTGVRNITSQSTEGFSTVVVQFHSGQSINQLAVNVQQHLAGIRASLPPGTKSPVVSKFNPNGAPILSVALSASGVPLTQLADYASNTLQPTLQRVPGVADIQVQGAPQRQIQVLLNPDTLTVFHLTPTQVASAIGAASVSEAAGNVNEGGQQVLYAVDSSAHRASQVAALPVDPQLGISVGDLATVTDRGAVATSYARVNGQPVVLLGVIKAAGSNAVAVAAGVKAVVAKLPLPAGYHAQIVDDTTSFIKASVNSTFAEIVATVLVVSLVVLIFLGRLNTVFSVILAIPISLSGALVVFGLLGFTYNIISLLSLVVAVGIVVDDSIVVAENIERYRALGFSNKDSVLRGAGEVVSAVTAASLSLLAVFLPISFLPGVIGHVFRQFGIGLAASVFFSWTEALFFLTVRMAYLPDLPLLPWREALGRVFSLRPFRLAFSVWYRSVWSWLGFLLLGALLLRLGTPWLLLLLAYPLWLGVFLYLVGLLYALLSALAGSLHRASEAGFLALQRGYLRALRAVLRAPGVTLAVAGLLLLSVGIVAPRIPFNFIPNTDSGTIQVHLTMPRGTALAQTNRLAREAEAYLLAQPGVKTVQSAVGVSSSVLAAPNSAKATLVTTLTPLGTHPPIAQLIARYRAGLARVFAAEPALRLRVSATSGAPGVSTNLQLVLSAPTPSLLSQRNAEVIAYLRRDPSLVNVRSALSQTTPEQAFLPRAASLRGTGLNALDIAQALRTYLVGSRAALLRQNGQDYPILVMAAPRFVANQSELLSLPIYAPALGTTLPLGDLGHFQIRQSPAALSQTNQAYSAAITATLAPGSKAGLLQVQSALISKLTQRGVVGGAVTLGPPAGSNFVGQLATDAPIAFGLALLLNFLVIASQFNTFRYPLYILIPVPLALVGAFWLAYAVGTGLDVISALGTVLLIGLVTKNAILLLDFAVREAQNLELVDALVEAGRLRLRPILMTTATVVIISFPLIFGAGQGAALRRPLGVITLGGLLSSTLLTLFVVPAAFYLFERRRRQPSAQAALPVADAGG